MTKDEYKKLSRIEIRNRLKNDDYEVVRVFLNIIYEIIKPIIKKKILGYYVHINDRTEQEYFIRDIFDFFIDEKYIYLRDKYNPNNRNNDYPELYFMKYFNRSYPSIIREFLGKKKIILYELYKKKYNYVKERLNDNIKHNFVTDSGLDLEETDKGIFIYSYQWDNERRKYRFNHSLGKNIKDHVYGIVREHLPYNEKNINIDNTSLRNRNELHYFDKYFEEDEFKLYIKIIKACINKIREKTKSDPVKKFCEYLLINIIFEKFIENPNKKIFINDFLNWCKNTEEKDKVKDMYRKSFNPQLINCIVVSKRNECNI